MWTVLAVAEKGVVQTYYEFQGVLGWDEAENSVKALLVGEGLNVTIQRVEELMGVNQVGVQGVGPGGQTLLADLEGDLVVKLSVVEDLVFVGVFEKL